MIRFESLTATSFALYPQLTVRANLEYGLKKHHVARTERDRRFGFRPDAASDCAGPGGPGVLRDGRPAWVRL